MATASDGHTRRRLANRERLYAAAVELFIEKGYEATTMEAIAERATVSRRTAFNHFPSKPFITVEWTRRRRRRASERSLVVGRATVTARLQAYYHELAVMTAETPLETQAMLLGWLTIYGPVKQPLTLPEEVAAWLDRTGGDNGLRTDAFRTAEILSNVYEGALWRWLRHDLEIDVVAEIDDAIDLSLRGLALGHTPGPGGVERRDASQVAGSSSAQRVVPSGFVPR